ncbi:putative mannitol dehydrogenase [Carex littledalei]|uniref:cinnamyl-alcohol dehydrogenase n=1 Tax=Carex littledalei TaxID=544730 RepID=A0A833RH99_9POAL|nr:putative mannitol dehydrogenase [Carex littledalei]
MAAPANGNKVAPELPRKAIGLAGHDTSGLLSPFLFSRRNNGDNDVTLKILYCGICHSDLHSLKNEWKNTMYPVVPGHEIVGEVTEVGSKVNKFKLGDKVGIGCLVNSCRSCPGCTTGFENYCPEQIYTYNSVDPEDGTVTYGGYSDMIVVNQDFVIHMPKDLPLDKAAPLLCAGITVYTPMKYHGLNVSGLHLGVVGLGGLGHVAVKFGKAFGMKVTVISSSPSKENEAIERLGADSFLVSSNAEQMKAANFSMDGIINTVSASHSVVPLLALLKPNGKMIMVGLPEKPLEVPAFSLIMGGKVLAGSAIGGIADTQEMIDFAGKHNITADIELIGADYVNKAMERLAKADVKYRFVIDIANTLKPNI